VPQGVSKERGETLTEKTDCNERVLIAVETHCGWHMANIVMTGTAQIFVEFPNKADTPECHGALHQHTVVYMLSHW
jgi:hypothetical protein